MTNGIVQLYVNLPQLKPGLGLPEAVKQVLLSSQQACAQPSADTLQAFSNCLRGMIKGTDAAMNTALAPIQAATTALREGTESELLGTVQQRLRFLNDRLLLITQQHSPRTQQTLAKIFVAEVGHFLETTIDTVEPIHMRPIPMPEIGLTTGAMVEPHLDLDGCHQQDLYHAEAFLGSLQSFPLEGTLSVFAAHLDKAIKAARHFERKARIDTLTGLLAKDEVRREMRYQLSRPNPVGIPIYRNAERPHIIWIADADRFKSINDMYGHAFGDVVIAAMGAVFREVIRDSDVAGRFGGDEFFGLLHHGNHIGAKLFAERFYRRLTELDLRTSGGIRVDLSGSIGFAEVEPGEDDVQKLITEAFERADAALIQAKNWGRGRACIWASTGIEELTTLVQHQGALQATGT